MALWLVRSGKHGEYEKRFLAEKRIFFTWEGLNRDLSPGKTREELFAILREGYPGQGEATIQHWARQAWAFVRGMQAGDWVAMPSKLSPAIHLAKVIGPYEFNPKAEDPYFHSRTVQWFALDIPRSNIDQDVLYSFGAFMTVCQITRNEAEARVKAMAQNDWKSAIRSITKPTSNAAASDETESVTWDIEEGARDEIAKLINARFKGHGLTRLVEAILKSQGYTTYRSPEGPDKGIDILAAPGALGFGQPRLCVQVKSGGGPVDSQTMNQLIGSMQNVQAAQGLLVSWDGFKQSVDKEVPVQFFRVRFWNRDDLIGQLLESYDRLDPDLRADLPLKRIWAVAATSEDDVET